MDSKICPKCGARWINGQHYWSGTNKKGNEEELANLVCDAFGDETCINQFKGTTKGDGWKKRLDIIDNLENDINRLNDR